MEGKELDSFKNFNKQNLDWKIALLEVKCGEEPSLPNAPFFANKIPDYFYFYQPEDTEFKEPSKRDLVEKLEILKKERTLNKVVQIKKDLYKLVTGAKNMEALKVNNKIKKTIKSAKEETDEDRKKELEKEVKDLEIEISLFKELNKENFVERMINRMIAKSAPLKAHSHLSSYAISAEIFKTQTSDTDVLNAKIVEKVENKLMASKLISTFMKDTKKQMFELLNLTSRTEGKVCDKVKDVESNKKNTDGENQDEATTEKKKIKLEVKSKRVDKKDASTSLFIGSLKQVDGFDETTDDFKDLYGVQGKNRPGQRTRRMLAEKKFGDKAKHLRPQKSDPGLEPSKSKKMSKSISKAKDTETEEKLHPSWQAKRKQKLDLTAAPQGTKIVFDEETTATKEADENLHPSWQAKRKQKLDLTAHPQGTKIVFEDQKTEIKPTEEENLHPSWVAKRNQKLAMASAPSNTKVKFED